MPDIITEKKKRILSGVQPTNLPHIGNFFGTMQNWGGFQNDFDAIYFVADLHAITVRMDAATLRNNTFDLYCMFLAMGIDPVKSVLFVQSHVPEHSELMWILSCFSQFGELSRMTQFKDKSQKHPDNVNAGLFGYPVLMAADILLYNSYQVPVGADQKQHLEIARDIAGRFNSLYGDVLTLPEPYIIPATARIMSLQETDRKMSKSDGNANATVFVLDDRNVIIKKFKRAVTDSGSEILYRPEDPEKAGVTNLISIYSAATGKSFSDIEKTFDGKGYGDFKAAVGETVADALAPVQAEFIRYKNDRAYIQQCMRDGAERASVLGKRTLAKMRKKLGLYTINN